MRDIFSSVALTFFAFLGFGIVTFTAKDLANPSRELPKAMYLALAIATVIYVAVSLGRVRHADGRRGDRLRWHGHRQGGRADARHRRGTG